MEKSEKRKVGALNIIAVFVPMIAYSMIMDYLHYKVLEWHSDILGYYYADEYLIVPSMILFFVCIRLFLLKTLFFKNLNRALNIAIFAFLALVFGVCSRNAFYNVYLTESGVKTPYMDFGAEAIASVKIGIKDYHKKGEEQYIELFMIREKFDFKFNTFQNDYTIADFYERYNGKLFFDCTDEPVEIEVFGLEHVDDYLNGNRLVTPAAAKRLRAFLK